MNESLHKTVISMKARACGWTTWLAAFKTPALAEVRGKRNAVPLYPDQFLRLHDLGEKRTPDEQAVYVALLLSEMVISPPGYDLQRGIDRLREGAKREALTKGILIE